MFMGERDKHETCLKIRLILYRILELDLNIKTNV